MRFVEEEIDLSKVEEYTKSRDLLTELYNIIRWPKDYLPLPDVYRNLRVNFKVDGAPALADREKVTIYAYPYRGQGKKIEENAWNA